MNHRSGLFTALALVVTLAGCASTVTVLGDGGADATSNDVTSSDVIRADVPTTDAPVTCGSTTCASGQLCCSATNQCYDPGCLACCMPRADAGPVPDGGRACTSASDCNTAAGEGCLFTTAGCGIPGVCGPDSNACARALGPYCGCDGQTFLENCEGPDRPWVSQGACHTPCQGNGDCLPDQYCCMGSGQCLPVGSGAYCPPVDGGLNDGGNQVDTTPYCTQASDCDTSAGYDCIFDNAGCNSSGLSVLGLCRFVPACGRPSLPYCGCNGQTFFDTCAGPDQQWVSQGQCGTGTADGGTVTDGGGVVSDAGTCAVDTDCASGQSCCTTTHRCYASGCLACCM